MSRNILIIGGTGIIGRAVALESLQSGFAVTTISLEKNLHLPAAVNQITANRTRRDEYRRTVAKLNQSVDRWDIVFDVYSLNSHDGEQTYDCFKDQTNHFFSLSTTLVYDRGRPSDAPIKSSHPLAALGTMGGYVDHKLGLEHFWLSLTKAANWTLIRPYHVLGAGSLIGCLPLHNRDPWLLERIKQGKTLRLVQDGNVPLNFIHPADIAKLVLAASGNPATFGKAYNAVNPQSITAREYFELVGRLLGQTVKIEPESIERVWREQLGWELTTLPHLYNVSDMANDIGFVPSISLETAMTDALKTYPKATDASKIGIHQRANLLPRPNPPDWLF